MEQFMNILKNQFNNRIHFSEKRPGIYQLLMPFYHEDGDMYDIFIERIGENGVFRISDYAMTVMRLSYEYEIDTPNKEKIYRKILTENGLKEDEGLIYIDAKEDSLYPALLQFIQGVGKVGNMRIFKREVIKGLFYEMLKEFVIEEMERYGPVEQIYPIPERDDLEVDYALNGRLRKPIDLFGIRDNAKARLVTISCLEFQKANLPYRGVAVHEDFEALGRKDRSRITSAIDKQFVTLDDFKKNGIGFIEREETI